MSRRMTLVSVFVLKIMSSFVRFSYLKFSSDPQLCSGNWSLLTLLLLLSRVERPHLQFYFKDSILDSVECGLVQIITAPALSISPLPSYWTELCRKCLVSGECYQYLVPRWDKIESPWDLRCLAILELGDH